MLCGNDLLTGQKGHCRHLRNSKKLLCRTIPRDTWIEPLWLPSYWDTRCLDSSGIPVSLPCLCSGHKSVQNFWSEGQDTRFWGQEWRQAMWNPWLPSGEGFSLPLSVSVFSLCLSFGCTEVSVFLFHLFTGHLCNYTYISVSVSS